MEVGRPTVSLSSLDDDDDDDDATLIIYHRRFSYLEVILMITT
jgi:hypothetical protein